MPTKRNNSIKNKFRLLWGMGCFFLALQLAGCGGASPPVGIPAPVSNLITVSVPDNTGTISIVGTPGAALDSALVRCGNITQGGQVWWWNKWLLGVAVAQTPQYEQDVISAPDGSFQMRLSAESGDVLRMVQIVDDVTSPATEITVP